jgi:hypothetical protein
MALLLHEFRIIFKTQWVEKNRILKSYVFRPKGRIKKVLFQWEWNDNLVALYTDSTATHTYFW